MSAKKTITNNSVKETFGNKIRIRACGLLFKDEMLLLAKHRIDDYILWSPPGGGVEFAESIERTLIREFKEETGLEIEVGDFLFFTEHIDPPLHAVELFYHVHTTDYDLILGEEPEFTKFEILQDIMFAGADELEEMNNKLLHKVLKSCTNPIELLDKQGHLK